MQITERNYPILGKFNDGKLGAIPISENDIDFFLDPLGQMFNQYWKLFYNQFSSNINYISKPFITASQKAKAKLFELQQDIAENDLSDYDTTGTFIINDLVFMLIYRYKKGSEDIEIAFYEFHKSGIPICFFVSSYQHDINDTGWISNYFNKGQDEKEIYEFIKKRVLDIVIIDMFKKYASVQTKELKPGKKETFSNDKWINNTRQNIIIVDSLWFTTLVNSGAFNVRGHFRLQPYKDRKELIWISEFEKKGYTRKAKKLSFYPDEENEQLQPLSL